MCRDHVNADIEHYKMLRFSSAPNFEGERILPVDFCGLLVELYVLPLEIFKTYLWTSEALSTAATSDIRSWMSPQLNECQESGLLSAVKNKKQG